MSNMRILGPTANARTRCQRAEAKIRLAIYFGVPAENIEITIRGQWLLLPLDRLRRLRRDVLRHTVDAAALVDDATHPPQNTCSKGNSRRSCRPSK
jgi:hypothetical protein